MSLLATPKTFRNIKTGNLYTFLGTTRDCTNAREGGLMALYHPQDQPNFPLVRDIAEFCKKFVEIK